MYLKTVLGTKKTAQLGMAGPAVAIIGIFISMALSPSFSWSEHALSDLGIMEYGIFFNASLIICGVFYLLFSIGLLLNTGKEKMGMRIGSLFMILASIALVGIGAFTMADATYTIHFIFAMSFFVLVLLAYIILGLSMMKDTELRMLGILGIIFGLMGIAGWALMGGNEAWAIPEAITVFPAAIWLFILAHKYYNKYNNFNMIIGSIDE